MDLLSQIWAAWNEEWGVTVATILSIIAIAMNAGEKFHKIWSAVRRWRVWPAIVRMSKSIRSKYRLRKAKRTMLQWHKENPYGMSIGIDSFGRCLDQTQLSSPRNILANVTPQKPSWLNDYYVAKALDSLSLEEKVAKATLYSTDSFPPRGALFNFVIVEQGKTAKELAIEIETNSMCIVYQCHLMCCEPSRHEAIGYSETVSPREVRHSTKRRLRPGAPPCVKCWDKIQRESDISRLVESITTYDLSASATIVITGERKEFQKAVTETCIESDCVTDVTTIKKIVEQAIEIRRRQLETNSKEHEMEWDEQETAHFVSALSVYIGDLDAVAR